MRIKGAAAEMHSAPFTDYIYVYTKDGNPLVGMRTGTRHEDGRLGD
jgi:hypothetical protein